VYLVDVVPDGAGTVRVTNAGGNIVENAMPGTELMVTVTPGLGYYIQSVTAQETDDGGGINLNSLQSTPLSGGASFSAVYEMPAKQVYVTADFTAIAGVAKVAYVSEEGWNDAGYSTTVHTADSWGTASNDLQTVINSWDGNNFTEVWVHGTVTPKTWANATGGYQITDTADNKNLAFVIPPGLKIYGGFIGTETATGTIASGNDPRLVNPDDRPETVLSGVLNRTANAYHVVILADINYTAPDTNAANTVLDGLTITGGVGADSPGTINFRAYTGTNGINKQFGAGLYLVNASPVLNNLRIENNVATANSLDAEGAVGGGGGIYNLAAGSGKTSSPRLTDVVISNNRVRGNGSGAGIYNLALETNVCDPVLSGVTIEVNQTSGKGGGIYNSAAQNAACEPKIKDNSRIIGNVASSGAGVYNDGYSAPMFTNVEIRGNIANQYGGGVSTQSATRPVFTYVTINGNSASSGGGGVDNRSYYLTMTNATISGNVASGNGGALFNRHSAAILTNVRIENNSANNGGGIYNTQDNPSVGNTTVLVMTNGIIRGNTSNYGGGIYNSYGTNFAGGGDNKELSYLALTNVLVAENTANQNGGGMYNANDIADSSDISPGRGIIIQMNNVTIAKNTANNGAGGGIYIPTANTNGTNKVTITAGNSIIWGNNAPSNTARANIANVTQSRLTLSYSLAQSGTYTDGGNNKAPGSFSNTLFTNFSAGDYTLSVGTTGLINGGRNNLYPTTADNLLGGALTGTARETDSKALIQAVVFGGSPRPINRDAAAAVGNASGTGNPRRPDTVIDVGAYEKQ
jgi:hypothetical protein